MRQDIQWVFMVIKKGSGEITSYDFNRRHVKPREVRETVSSSVALSKTVNDRFVKIHLKGYVTPNSKAKNPNKILKSSNNQIK